jgi:hypothetical protein
MTCFIYIIKRKLKLNVAVVKPGQKTSDIFTKDKN